MGSKAVGIIGGSGLYQIDGLKIEREVSVKTPFGKSSGKYLIGEFEGHHVVFLPRHGKGHVLSPTEVNYRANIYGMKALGVEWIIAVTATGSLKEGIRPGDIVIIDQIIDRTRVRSSTFFEGGIAAHAPFADPFCPELRKILISSAKEAGATVHEMGTYVCMEGPQFSTRAESFWYKSWGADLIGMTNLQEAKLAREAEICYAAVALSTDYDCWHDTEEDVTVDAVLEMVRKNTEMAKRIIHDALPKIGEERKCMCGSAMANAIITDKNAIPGKVKKRLKLIIGKYLS